MIKEERSGGDEEWYIRHPLNMCCTVIAIALACRVNRQREPAVRQAFEVILERFPPESHINFAPKNFEFHIYACYPGVDFVVEVFDCPEVKKLLDDCRCAKCVSTDTWRHNEFFRPTSGVFTLYVLHYDEVDDPTSCYIKWKKKREKKLARLKALGIIQWLNVS